MVLSFVIFSGSCTDEPRASDDEPAQLAPVQVIPPSATPLDVGFVSTFLADSASGVFVADLMNRNVHLLDSRGRAVTRFGRDGEGPGEFRDINLLGLGGGRLAVADRVLRRVTVFSIADGAVAVTVDLGDFIPGWEWDQGGRIALIGDSLLGVPGLAMGSDVSLDGRAVMGPEYRVYTTEGRIVRRVQLDGRQRAKTDVLGMGGMTIQIAPPFEPWQVGSVGAGGDVWLAWGGDYAIAELGSTGDTARLIRRSVAPRVRDSVELAGAREYARALITGFGGDESELAKVPIDASRQQIVSIAASVDGSRLWVLRTERAPDPVYDVFDAGVFQCTVELKAGTGLRADVPSVPPSIVGGRLFHFALTENDEARWLVYDVSSPCPER